MNWDYLAGFTDGEGHIGIIGGRAPKITWGQKDRDTILAIQKFLIQNGFHPLLHEIRPNPPKKPNPIHMLSLCRREEVKRFINITKPLLIQKVYQCETVMKWMEDHPKIQRQDEIDVERVKNYVKEGYSGSWIAKTMGFTKSQLFLFGKRNAIKFNTTGGRYLNGKKYFPPLCPCGRRIRNGFEKCGICFRKSQPNYCLDCKKLISNRSKRCLTCSNKHRAKISKFPKNNYCIDCNKNIDRRAKRCKSCAQKEKIIRKKLLLSKTSNTISVHNVINP